jgi:two-component system NtrC family response regulator
MKRAVIMADGSRLSAADLDLAEVEDDDFLNLRSARERADRNAIRMALARTESNVSNAAKLLGVSRPTLYDLLKQYNIET